MKIALITLALIGMLAGGHALASPSICYGQANGYMTANPTASNMYYVCSDGVPVPVECPNGLIFCSFQNSKTCSLTCAGVTGTTQAPTIPTAPTSSPLDRDSSVCASLSNGVILPISGSCSGYIMCLNGASVVGQCLGNRAFNGATGACSETLCSS